MPKTKSNAERNLKRLDILGYVYLFLIFFFMVSASSQSGSITQKSNLIFGLIYFLMSGIAIIFGIAMIYFQGKFKNYIWMVFTIILVLTPIITLFYYFAVLRPELNQIAKQEKGSNDKKN